jgi:putative peptidoglycan lipid II flippase
LRNYDFRKILRQLPPRSIDQGIDSINSIVETNRAATLGVGNITYYENAYTLHMAPILLIGTTIATAAFPRLNSRLAQGRPDLFRKDFLRVLRAMIWIILPVVIISFFARGYFARLIFKRDSGQIALIFGFLAGAIFFRTLYAIISRYFYSHKDTKTPLFVSIIAIALNIYLAFTLTKLYGVAGLAIAQSIVATVEVIVLLIIIVWRDHHLFTMVRIFSVTGFTMITAYTMVKLLPLSVTDRGFITLGTKLFFIIVPTLIVHIGISSLFEVEEAKPVIDKLRKLILKPIRIQ